MKQSRRAWCLGAAAGVVLLSGGAVLAKAARTMQEVRAQFPEGSSEILDKADRVVLYELDPTQRGKVSSGTTFWEYPVVREKELTEPRERAELIRTLYEGMAEQKVGARCFVPHHGLRAVRGGKTLDLVLCFTCQWVHIHYNGKTKAALLSARGMPIYQKALRGVPANEAPNGSPGAASGE